MTPGWPSLWAFPSSSLPAVVQLLVVLASLKACFPILIDPPWHELLPPSSRGIWVHFGNGIPVSPISSSPLSNARLNSWLTCFSGALQIIDHATGRTHQGAQHINRVLGPSQPEQAARRADHINDVKLGRMSPPRRLSQRWGDRGKKKRRRKNGIEEKRAVTPTPPLGDQVRTWVGKWGTNRKRQDPGDKEHMLCSEAYVQSLLRYLSY